MCGSCHINSILRSMIILGHCCISGRSHHACPLIYTLSMPTVIFSYIMANLFLVKLCKALSDSHGISDDAGGAASSYNLLLALGEGFANLHLADVGAQLAYAPGTLVFLTGKVLEHEVPEWEGGERAVVAHYMKDLLHDRLHVPRPTLPSQASLWSKFGSGQ